MSGGMILVRARRALGRLRATPASGPRPTPDYLSGSSRINVIQGAFFVLTVPLCLLRSWRPGRLADALSAAYIVSVGYTHFALTWALYLNSENRQYFSSTRKNRVLYFATPSALMAIFAVLGASGVPTSSSGAGPTGRPTRPVVALSVLLKAVDYYHVARQSFGVLQLLKSGAGLPGWQRRWENYFFLATAAAELNAYLLDLSAGSAAVPNHQRLDRLTIPVRLALVVVFIVIAGRYVVAVRRSAERSKVVKSLRHFVLQSANAAIVVHRPDLYRFALAMHFVEYHVLMAPRVFRAPLDPAQPSDRLVAWLRSHQTVFYGCLLGSGLWIGTDVLYELRGFDPSRARKAQRFVIHALDGIFVSHYFVEAMVWRFGNAFYRGQLGPIYFGPGRPRSS